MRMKVYYSHRFNELFVKLNELCTGQVKFKWSNAYSHFFYGEIRETITDTHCEIFRLMFNGVTS